VALGAFIVVALLIQRKKTEQQPEQSVTAPVNNDNLIDILTQRDPELEKAMKIREFAKERRELAESRKLDDLMVEVYEETQHFPSWIKKDRNYVPKIVKNARYIDKEKDEYELVIGDNTYRIKQKQTSGPENETYLTLTLLSDEKKVFEVSCSVDYGQYSTKYRPFSIGSYIEGVWESDVTTLLHEIKQLEQERRRKELVDPEELEELKKSYDIPA